MHCTICKNEFIDADQQKNTAGDIICAAIMIDDCTFDYGLIGRVKFQNYRFKKGDLICNACLISTFDNLKPDKSVELII